MDDRTYRVQVMIRGHQLVQDDLGLMLQEILTEAFAKDGKVLELMNIVLVGVSNADTTQDLPIVRTQDLRVLNVQAQDLTKVSPREALLPTEPPGTKRQKSWHLWSKK